MNNVVDKNGKSHDVNQNQCSNEELIRKYFKPIKSQKLLYNAM